MSTVGTVQVAKEHPQAENKTKTKFLAVNYCNWESVKTNVYMYSSTSAVFPGIYYLEKLSDPGVRVGLSSHILME